jgi:surface carbohydrate biosynthesis protein
MIIKAFQNASLTKPETADIVIFDTHNSSIIKHVIPDGLSVGSFKTRPVEINLSLKIFSYFLLNLKIFSIKACLQSRRGFFYQALWQLQMIYILSDLKLRKPRALITNIDNCHKFAWLSQNFENVPCIGIQNGFRASFDVDCDVAYYCNHLFCFGQREVFEFPNFGYRFDHIYPVGSLQLEKNFKRELLNVSNVYDLLIISCWRGNIGFGQDVYDSMQAMRVMDKLLAKYLSRHNLRAAVVLRSERDSDQWIMPEIGMSEEKYYQSIYGEKLEIIDVNFAERNVYSAMQVSDVIVAAHSTTCLLEALALGKKILYANFTGSDKYHCDLDPNIIFSGDENDEDHFFNRLDALRNMSGAVFYEKNKNIMEYYVLNPRTHSAEAMIKAKISNILEENDKKGVE